MSDLLGLWNFKIMCIVSQLSESYLGIFSYVTGLWPSLSIYHVFVILIPQIVKNCWQPWM